MGKVGLSREEIVAAAIALTEEGGVDSLTMRSLGARLGTSAMAMYRYVSSREGLLDAMVGRVLASVAVPGPDVSWEERLRTVAHGLLRAAYTNPTVFVMVLSRSYRDEEAVAVMAGMYQILVDAGVPDDEVPRVERMVSTALIGFAVSASSEAFWPTDPTLTDGRLTRREEGGAPGAGAVHRHDELDRNVDDLIAVIRAA